MNITLLGIARIFFLQVCIYAIYTLFLYLVGLSSYNDVLFTDLLSYHIYIVVALSCIPIYARSKIRMHNIFAKIAIFSIELYWLCILIYYMMINVFSLEIFIVYYLFIFIVIYMGRGYIHQKSQVYLARIGFPLMFFFVLLYSLPVYTKEVRSDVLVRHIQPMIVGAINNNNTLGIKTLRRSSNTNLSKDDVLYRQGQEINAINIQGVYTDGISPSYIFVSPHGDTLFLYPGTTVNFSLISGKYVIDGFDGAMVVSKGFDVSDDTLMCDTSLCRSEQIQEDQRIGVILSLIENTSIAYQKYLTDTAKKTFGWEWTNSNFFEHVWQSTMELQSYLGIIPDTTYKNYMQYRAIVGEDIYPGDFLKIGQDNILGESQTHIDIGQTKTHFLKKYIGTSQ